MSSKSCKKQLTTLDVSTNTELNRIEGDFNLLTSLDVCTLNKRYKGLGNPGVHRHANRKRNYFRVVRFMDGIRLPIKNKET